MDKLKRILSEILREESIEPGKIVFAHEMIPDIIARSDDRFTKTWINVCIKELAEQGYLSIEGVDGLGWNFTEKWFAEFGCTLNE
jgi:hypothetical protein